MEDIINQIDGQVQIIFERGEGFQTYRDALWMTQAEYDSTPSETIEALKQERYDNWIAVITGLPTVETAVIEAVITETDSNATATSDSATTDSQPTDPV